MRLPLRQIKIAGQKIKVKLDPKINVWGLCDYDGKTIYIGQRVIEDPDSLTQTLIHEVRHMGLHLAGVSHGLPAKLEEQIIRCLDEICDPTTNELVRKLTTKNSQKKKKIR